MKITIDDIKAQFASVNSINQRFQQVQDEFNNSVLYRLNPEGEPNGMNNDLDMQEFDILNGGIGNFDELIVGGEPIGGDHLWGNITGELSNQTDLYNALTVLALRTAINEDGIEQNDKDIFVLQAISVDQQQDIDALFDQVGNKLSDVTISFDNHTATSLEMDRTAPYAPELRLTDAVGTDEPFALVKLGVDGLIANNLLPVTGAYNSLGTYLTVTDPAPADNPTIRFPLETFLNGDIYTISVPSPQTDGAVLIIDPDTQLPVTVRLSPGDALLYVAGSGTNVEGWYGAEKRGAGGLSAFDISYDPNGNLVINDPASINVDAALTDLDTEANRVRAESAQNVLDIDTKVSKAGDTVTGQIKGITPIDPPDFAIKEYVDERFDEASQLGAPLTIGSVIMWTDGAVIPDGMLEMNGQTVDSVIDPRLQEIVDILNPGGNTTAVIPDTRGEFIRGYDNGRGADAGRTLLTAQAEELKAHTHTALFTGIALATHTHTFTGVALPGHFHHSGARYQGSYNDLYNTYGSVTNPGSGLGGTVGTPGRMANSNTISAGTPTGTNVAISAGVPAGTIAVDATLGVETRPRNVALMYIIKAFNETTLPVPPPSFLDLVYPIGAHYISGNLTDPSTLFGGTWVQLAEGEFLMNTVGGAEPAGGSNDQVLPAHAHGASAVSTFTGTAPAGHFHRAGLTVFDSTVVRYGGAVGGGANTPNRLSAGSGTQNYNANTSTEVTPTPAGSVATTPTVNSEGVALVGGENRPAFKGLSIWERTA